MYAKAAVETEFEIVQLKLAMTVTSQTGMDVIHYVNKKLGTRVRPVILLYARLVVEMEERSRQRFVTMGQQTILVFLLLIA